MKKERMAILKMVSDGKITVDEAVKLMDSINNTKTIDASDVISTVKEKVSDIVEEAKPVVKKCAAKAKEVGEDVYNMGKAKVEEYKAKARNADDIIDEVVDEAEDVAEDVAETVADTVEEVAEETKEAFETDNDKEEI